MASTGPVHWHEGLFLQPHHLQVMQRFLLDQTFQARELAFPYSHGLVKLELAGGELEKKLVRIKSLQAVMPSGLVIESPGNADIPALHINDRFDRDSKPFIVCL